MESLRREISEKIHTKPLGKRYRNWKMGRGQGVFVLYISILKEIFISMILLF